jgi:hypothetical protein
MGLNDWFRAVDSDNFENLKDSFGIALKCGQF